MRTCLLATRLGEAAGLGAEEIRAASYAALLRYVGSTSDAYEAATLFAAEHGLVGR